jgi:alpha-methylacyl-CoA racemase
VLPIDETPRHPHHVARGTYVTVDGVVQPGPAPRFSRAKAGLPTPPVAADAAGVPAALAGWLTEAEIAGLQAAGTLPAA